MRDLIRLLRRLSRLPLDLESLLEIETRRLVLDLLRDPRHADPRSLNRFEHRVCSQGGEDGILAEVLRRVGAGPRCFVEFGAGDGENNTAALLLRGWRGLWLEASPGSVKRCRRAFAPLVESGALAVRQALVTAENIVELLASNGAPADLDVLSIDIDGNDHRVWRAIEGFSPRVVIIEYNGYLPADVCWAVPYEPRRIWDRTTHFGASLKALEKLGSAKGYTLVGCTLAGTNAFFVRSDLVGESFAGPFTSERLWHPARPYLAIHRGLGRRFLPFVAP